jgi:hypothetical protein
MSRRRDTFPRTQRRHRLSWDMNPQQIRRRHCLSWAIENPLFALAAFVLIAGIVIVIPTAIRGYVGPSKHVIVEFYELDIGVTLSNTTISLERVTYQPGFDVRLNRFSRKQSKPLVIIDGSITNDGTAPVVAFFLLDDHPAGVLVSRHDGTEVTSLVNTRKVELCPNELLRIPIINPGSSRKFSVSLATERNSAWSWVKDEVKNGQLPALSFGPFAEGHCTAAAEGSLFEDTWRLEFQPQALGDVEMRDYYPFSAPTTNEIGLFGRRYWADWLPRLK